MAQHQNLFAALLAAFNLAPPLVRQAQQSGAPNDVKHSRVASILLEAAHLALPVAGVLVSASNPMFAPLIDAAIKAAVEATKADGTLDVPPAAPLIEPAAGSPMLAQVVGQSGQPVVTAVSAVAEAPVPE